MATAYASVAEFKQTVEKVGTSSDALIQRLLDASAFCVDHWTNRTRKLDSFVADTTASPRYFSTRGGYDLFIQETVQITEVAQKPSVTDDSYVALTTDDWVAFSGSAEKPDFNVLPYDGIMITATGTQIPFVSGGYTYRAGFRPDRDNLTVRRRQVPTVRVTARWGYADTVPPVVKEATILLAARWWKRGTVAWSDSLASADFGMMMYRQSRDPDLIAMLEIARLIRPSFAGS